MKKKGKVLALMLSAAALVAASVFGTMAYLTDNEAVTNTFTVGRVGLSLDELDVDKDSDKDDNVTVDDNTVRDKANKYHLLPGHKYVKDPTVHIDKESESCWVFVRVVNGLVRETVNRETVNIEAATETTVDGYKTVADQIADNGWNLLTNGDDPVPNVYYKQWTKPAGIVDDNYYDLLVFEEFKIAGDDVDNAILETFADAQIVVTAYAVQLDGFEGDPYSAWEAADFKN